MNLNLKFIQIYIKVNSCDKSKTNVNSEIWNKIYQKLIINQVMSSRKNTYKFKKYGKTYFFSKKIIA